jgi:hypothetical protein
MTREQGTGNREQGTLNWEQGRGFGQLYIFSRSHALYGNELRKALPSLILSPGGRASKWHSQSETGNEEYYL